MKKIVIFGATGNIGAYLVDYLKKFLDDFQIIATGRKNTNFYNNKGIDYINVDICNKDDFDKLPIDDIYAVINCAGILPAYLSDFNPYLYVDVNIIGSLNILEYARRVNADRVVYTQTWSVQGGYWNEEEMYQFILPSADLVHVGGDVANLAFGTYLVEIDGEDARELLYLLIIRCDDGRRSHLPLQDDCLGLVQGHTLAAGWDWCVCAYSWCGNCQGFRVGCRAG